MDQICIKGRVSNPETECIDCMIDNNFSEVEKSVLTLGSVVNHNAQESTRCTKLLENKTIDLELQVDEFKKYITSHIASHDTRLKNQDDVLIAAQERIVILEEKSKKFVTCETTFKFPPPLQAEVKIDTNKLTPGNYYFTADHPNSIHVDIKTRHEQLLHVTARLQGKLDRATDHIAELKKNQTGNSWPGLQAAIFKQRQEIVELKKKADTVDHYHKERLRLECSVATLNECNTNQVKIITSLKAENERFKYGDPREYDRMKAANGSLEKEIIELKQKLKSADQSWLIGSLRSEIVSLKTRNSELERACAARMGPNLNAFNPILGPRIRY